jgi:PAS domain S-box-containing protein
MVGWTLMFAVLITLQFLSSQQVTKNLALKEAKSHFQKDEAFRFWASTHGGFYVPVNDRTPPNPYLVGVAERDIETKSGEKLTLMNPAYALRQMNQEYAETYGVAGHITSLLPLNPDNKPDAWEKDALESFEKGISEIYEFSDFENKPALRFMRPLVTKKGCLKCHRHQGYVVGDIRGGVSVAVPMGPYLAEEKQSITVHLLSYFLIWILGLVGIWLALRVIKKKNTEKEISGELLKESYGQLETRVQQRTAELAKLNYDLQVEIGNRKHIESKLTQNENTLRQVIDTAPNCIFVKDRNGKYLIVNKKMAELHHLSIDALVGKYDHEIAEDWFKTVEYQSFRNAEQSVIDNQEVLFLPDEAFLYQDGTTRWFQTTKIPFNMEGEGGCVLVFSVDVTERKKAEEASQESENELSAIFHDVRNGIALLDTSGKITRVNKYIVDMGGYAENELVGKQFDSLQMFLPASIESMQRGFGRLVEGLDVDPYEVELFTKNGDKKIFHLHNSFLKKDGQVDGIIIILRDVTEHKQNEKVQAVLYNIAKAVNSTKTLDELYQTIHQLLSNVIDNTNFFIALCDPFNQDISFPYFVDEKQMKPGKVPKEMSNGLTEYVIRTGESLLATKDFYQKLIDKGEIVLNGELPEVWVGIPLRIEKKIIGVMVVQSYIDISVFNDTDLDILELISYQIAIAIENKKTEQVNVRLSETIRKSGDGIVLTDADGLITYVNPAYEQMSGYSLDELLNTDPANHIVAEDTKTLANELRLTVKTHGQWVGEMYCKRKNKEHYPIETHIFPIRDKKGDVVEIAAIQHEISKRKRAEQVQKLIYNISNAVSASDDLEAFISLIQKELGSIIDATNFYIAFYDKETDAISLPFHRDQKDDFSFFPAGKSLTAYVIKTKKSLLATKDVKERLLQAGEIELFGADSKVWLGVPLMIKGNITGSFAVQSYTDENAYDESDVEILEFVAEQISVSIDRKRAELEIINALERAKESDRLKSAFLATMSHELRTPLNAIIGFSEMVDHDLSADEIDQCGQTINSSGNHLLSIVEDLFEVTLIDSGEIKIQKSVVPLRKPLDEVYEIIKIEKQRLKKDSLLIELILPPKGAEISVYTDPSKLKQILINLLKNALKFTHEGSINFGFEIDESGTRPMLKFFVKDSGIGIPKEMHQLIFEDFRQVEDTLSRTYGGTGIGLSISKKLTKLLGGDILVESEEEKGSSFFFTIPLELPETERKLTKLSIEKEVMCKSKRVLIVEDVEESFRFLEIVLGKAGFEILWAENGEESIKICKEDADIALVLMDINMPVMNGYEATRAIKKLRPQLPIIAQTAYAITGDREKSLAVGCDDYISKPIKRELLIGLIRKYVK